MKRVNLKYTCYGTFKMEGYGSVDVAEGEDWKYKALALDFSEFLVLENDRKFDHWDIDLIPEIENVDPNE